MEANDYRPKAGRLVSVAELAAIGSRDTICSFYPQIRLAARFHQWDFFTTVAVIWTVFVRIRYDFQVEQRHEIEFLVESKLTSWNPSGLSALHDLNTFVIQCGLREPDESKRPLLTSLSAGTWILWNLTDKNPIDKESEIAECLGHMFVDAFMAYWLLP